MAVFSQTPIYPALVIDGSGSSFFAGILEKGGQWAAYEKASEPALESLFATVDAVLEKAGLDLEHIGSFLYCEGPGSVLGLRLCAMAIETWKRVQAVPPTLFAYNSLKLVGACLVAGGEVLGDALLVSDWKKDMWNGLKIHSSHLGPVAPVGAKELADWQGALYRLPARKGWQKPPEKAIELSYEPERLAQQLRFPALIELRETVDLYHSGLNSFRKWKPVRHRAAANIS
jgi:tRNA threonylcarbamoyladenosine biosynthesis protein TsaB